MEGLQNLVPSFSSESKLGSLTNFPGITYHLGSEGGGSTGVSSDSSFPVDSSRGLATTAASLCAIYFVAGIVVGWRVRGWASWLLKRLKDD